MWVVQETAQYLWRRSAVCEVREAGTNNQSLGETVKALEIMCGYPVCWRGNELNGVLGACEVGD